MPGGKRYSLVWNYFKPYARGTMRVFGIIVGSIYDFTRFIRFSSWRERQNDPETRTYLAAILYHALEKSMSFQGRDPKAGWRNAFKLLRLLKHSSGQTNISYHERASKEALDAFSRFPNNVQTSNSVVVQNELSRVSFGTTNIHGVLNKSYADLQNGRLESPEMFFLTRHSVRYFKEELVPKNIVERAFLLALKTPSVCNRQAWHVYHSADKKVIQAALDLQNGNKPFGDHISNLLIIAADLKGFFSGDERYQPWIDGGLFAMSMMYAFHALGIASCALNWSSSPSCDMKLRGLFNIKDSHNVVMFIAFGYPLDVNIVCSSARRPMEEIYTALALRGASKSN